MKQQRFSNNLFFFSSNKGPKSFAEIVFLLVVVVGLFLVAFTFIGAFVTMKQNTNSTISDYDPSEKLKTGGAIYTGEGLTVNMMEIDWGTVYPNENISRKVTVTNNFADPTVLSFSGEWNPPEAKQYLSLDWDYNGKPISGKNLEDVTFTLSVSPKVKNITNLLQ